jgi:hypothetical protein
MVVETLNQTAVFVIQYWGVHFCFRCGLSGTVPSKTFQLKHDFRSAPVASNDTVPVVVAGSSSFLLFLAKVPSYV